MSINRIRMMATVTDIVNICTILRQLGTHVLMQPVDGSLIIQTKANAPLVGNDEDPKTGLVAGADRLDHTWHQYEIVWPVQIAAV